MRRNRSHVGNIVEIIFIILYIIIALLFAIYFFIHTRSGGIGGSNTTNPSKGDVKVDLIDESGENSLVGKILSFETENESGTLYFEPGLVCHTQAFRIKNIGTLPIDYNITISTEEGETLEEFTKAFEFWITTDPEEGNTQELLDHRGQLDPGESSECYYLVVSMRQSAGNEYQGKSYKGVGISVNAVQHQNN